jgi:hypothetical protein
MTPKGVLLHGDAVVAAHAVGLDPLDPGHELHDLELLDLVLEPADLRLLELEPAPLDGVGAVTISLTISTTFARPATPFSLSCWKARGRRRRPAPTSVEDTEAPRIGRGRGSTAGSN